jgi:molecular chaperone HscB
MELGLESRSGQSAAPIKCATCDVLQHAPLACQDCHELLAHVQGADYFELFGLPRTYSLSDQTLRERHLAISRNIHPDRFAGAGPEMQSFALRLSASVNKANEVLSDPWTRANYLLELSGGQSAAQDKRVPQEILTQTMMLREEIEEARSNGDGVALDAIRTNVERMWEQHNATMATLCDSLPGNEKVRSDLREQLNIMKYVNNLLGQL